MSVGAARSGPTGGFYLHHNAAGDEQRGNANCLGKVAARNITQVKDECLGALGHGIVDSGGHLRIAIGRDLLNIDYMAALASNITTVKAAVAGADMTETEKVLQCIIDGSNKAAAATRELIKQHDAAEAIEDAQEQANAYANDVIPAMEALRAEIDALEVVVERDYWPVPTYNDILFYA